MAKKIKEGAVLLEQQMNNLLESIRTLSLCIVEAEANNLIHFLEGPGGGFMGMDFVPHITTNTSNSTQQNGRPQEDPLSALPRSSNIGGPNGPVTAPSQVKRKVEAVKTIQQQNAKAGVQWTPPSLEGADALGMSVQDIVKEGEQVQVQINKQPGSLGERFFNWLKEMFAGIADAMPKIFNFLWRGIQLVFEFVGKTFGQVREKLSNLTPQQKDQIKSVFLFGGISAGVIWLVSKLVKWFRGGLSRLMNSVEFNAACNRLIQEWDEEIKEAKLAYRKKLNEANANSAFEIPPDAQAKIVKLSNTAMESLVPVYTEVYNTWQKTKSPFWGAMTSLMDKIQKLFLAFVAGLSVPASAQ